MNPEKFSQTENTSEKNPREEGISKHPETYRDDSESIEKGVSKLRERAASGDERAQHIIDLVEKS